MYPLDDGQLKGAFKGFRNSDTVFQFMNGNKWRQAEHKYVYHYAYMPQAKVVERDGRHWLEVEGMIDSVEVTRV